MYGKCIQRSETMEKSKKGHCFLSFGIRFRMHISIRWCGMVCLFVLGDVELRCPQYNRKELIF